VAHVCNPSCLRDGDQEDQVLMPFLAKKFVETPKCAPVIPSTWEYK
jgi:hypothetical protein